MGFLLLLLPLLLLGAAYSGAKSGRERRAMWTQGPGVGPLSPSGTSRPFWVRLSPVSAEVQPGGSVWLNCSSSCPFPEDYGLTTQLQKGKTSSGPGWVSYQLLDVRAWSSDVHCFVTCAGERRWAKARVTAYKRPRSVILESVVSGDSKYTLRCHVTHVFPVGFLVVTLRRGGRVIHSESLERFTKMDLANVTVTHTLPSTSRDLWKPLMCQARLNLNGLVVRSNSEPLILTSLVWSTKSKALSSTSMAALVILLLAMGATYIRSMVRRSDPGQ